MSGLGQSTGGLGAGLGLGVEDSRLQARKGEAVQAEDRRSQTTG